MAAISDEELQAKRDHVAELRQQIREETSANEAAAHEKSLELEANQLDREAERLQAQLDAAKAAASAASESETASQPSTPTAPTPPPAAQTQTQPQATQPPTTQSSGGVSATGNQKG